MDERCKAELKSSFDKCSTEGTNLSALINDILQKQKLVLENIKQYDAHETKANRSVIINSTQLNYSLFNKLFSLNIELEEFWNKCLQQAPTSLLPLYNTNQINVDPNLLTHDDIQRESTGSERGKLELDKSPCSLTSENTSSVSESKHELNPLVKQFIPHAKFVPVVLQDLKLTENDHNLLLSSDHLVANTNKDINQEDTNTDTNNLEHNRNLSESTVSNRNNGIKAQVTNIEHIESLSKVCSDDVKSNKSSESTNKSSRSSKNKKTRENDDKQQKTAKNTALSNSTEVKLQKNKPKDRFERKFGGATTEIPDLSFVRDDSVSDYNSVTSPKTNNKNLNEEIPNYEKEPGAIKKQKELKKDPKENIQEIMDGQIPQVGDACIVTFVKNPSEFYIALCEGDLLMSMGEQLGEYVQSGQWNFRNKLDAKLAISKYCVAYAIEYNCWNRAEIKDWKMTDPENVDVQYVDFGEYASVSYLYLVPIPQNLCKIPKLSTRCSVLNLVPRNKEERWSSEATATFEGICYNSGEYACMHVTAIEKTSNGIGVDLYNVDQNKGKSCCQELIASGHARLAKLPENADEQQSSSNFMVEQIKTAQGLVGCSEHNDARGLDDFCNTMPEVYDTIGDAMLGYNAQDDVRLCKFTRHDGTCFKGAGCRLEHRQRRNNGVTTDTEVVLVAPENTFMPQVNEEFNVYITFFQSPSVLYGQMQHSGNGYGAVMKEILSCMNAKSMIQSYETFQYSPAIGELVIAQSFDSIWYRACVLEVNSGEAIKSVWVKLFFVDLGEVGEVPVTFVRKMKRGFVLHPYQATRMGVSNVKAKPDFDFASFEEFTSKYVFKTLKMTVKYAGGDFIDAIYKDSEGKDLGGELVAHNFAKPNTMDLHPLRSTNILVD